jgi:oligoribonuclease (3'-5' exoribonuclease)
MSKIQQFGLAIDWETSGYSLPNYAEKHQGVSFGAIIFDMRTFNPVESLYREIKFIGDKYEWSTGAERVHGLSKEHLAKNGIDQQQAAFELGSLILKYIGTEQITLLGHRVYFDRSFTDQLMNSIDVRLEYNPTMIDSCSISTVLLEMTRSDDIFKCLGLPDRGKHNALEDIENTLFSIKQLKNYFIQGISCQK